MEKKSSAAERIGRGKEEEESPEVEKLEQEEEEEVVENAARGVSGGTERVAALSSHVLALS